LDLKIDANVGNVILPRGTRNEVGSLRSGVTLDK